MASNVSDLLKTATKAAVNQETARQATAATAAQIAAKRPQPGAAAPARAPGGTGETS